MNQITQFRFNAPNIPKEPRDVSAGAVICSGLIELAGYVGRKTGREYMRTAETMLRSLTSGAYHAASGENGGFILENGVGNFPRNADIDVPLIYADYYYLEALTRYKALGKD